MTDAAFSPTERSTIRRLPSRGSYDCNEIYDILDQGILAHVGLSTPFFRFTNIEVWENSEPAFGRGQRGAGSSQASGEEVQL